MKKFVLIASVAFFAAACETDITDQVNLGEPQRRLVVEGGVNHVLEQPRSVQEVFLTESTDYFDTQVVTPVTNATVSIADECGQSFELVRSNAEPGWYRSDSVEILQNATYTLTIDWNGERYTASERVAPVAPIDSLFQTFVEESEFNDAGIRVNISFTDVAGEENYYFWEVFADGENQIIPDPGNGDNLIQSDEFFDGARISGYQPNEEAILEPGQIAQVRQYGISKRYFDFLRTLFQQTTDIPGILDTPPAALSGNVVNTGNPRNPGLGYFRASEVSIREITIQD